MAKDRQHHTSKKKRYTIIVVPDEDASKAKNFQFAPWQVGTMILFFASLSAVLALLIFAYTPLGQLFPLMNPGLENEYNKALVTLNQRMANMMEQLVEMRAYNIKLRRAMGENIALSDSNSIVKGSQNKETNKNKGAKEERSTKTVTQALFWEQRYIPAQTTRVEAETHISTTFPAILPTEGYITRGFEPEENHYGLDFAGKKGTFIVAAADGNVVFSGWTYEDGYIIIISHVGGFMTYYKHNQTLLKSANAFVRRGEPIATLGDSGSTSSGPHLHFEVWRDGVPVDPSMYLINLYL